jgi:hypothetical protein
MPVILATQEAEVQDQSGQKVSETPSQHRYLNCIAQCRYENLSLMPALGKNARKITKTRK